MCVKLTPGAGANRRANCPKSPRPRVWDFWDTSVQALRPFYSGFRLLPHFFLPTLSQKPASSGLNPQTAYHAAGRSALSKPYRRPETPVQIPCPLLQPHPMMTEHHSHGMMGRDWDDGGMHRMMGTERRGGAA